METQFKRALKVATCVTAILALTACSGIRERLENVGKAPEMSQIENPYQNPNYKPVSLPMPAKAAENTAANSLWQSHRQTFFKDQRANQVGDILTVMIDIKDKADLDNKTERTRSGTEATGLTNLFGLETQLTDKVFPEALDPTSLADMNTDSTSVGDGIIEREEEIQMRLAAMITQVLPNGNFVIQGRQQVRVNNELRDLQLQGVIRPEDIGSDNSITHDKIAEARISYGGKGNISELQQPRYGQQIFDIIMPF